MANLRNLKNKMVFVLLLSGLSLLYGCATTQSFQNVVEAGSGLSKVYFIRKHYPPTLLEASIIVNDSKLATLADNDYVAVNLPIGKNNVLIEATSGKPFKFVLNVENAERLYVLLTGDVYQTGSTYNYGSMTINMQWQLNAINLDQEKAKSLVKEFGKDLR